METPEILSVAEVARSASMVKGPRVQNHSWPGPWHDAAPRHLHGTAQARAQAEPGALAPAERFDPRSGAMMGASHEGTAVDP